MIDAKGYRPNVGIILTNAAGQVFWAKRVGQEAWQFPQGGINDNEKVEDALFRELYEEVGLLASDVKILAQSRCWLKYRLPRRLVRSHQSRPVCIGQKQKWFLLKLEAAESKIKFDATIKPEFDDWHWVSYWYPLHEVIAFKKDVYRKALKEFRPYLLPTIIFRGKLDPFPS